MEPQNVYFLTLALVVIPLLPFSRSALVVGAAWLPGQFTHVIGLDPTAVDMCVAIMACGAGLGVAANERDEAVSLMFLATASVHMGLLLGTTDPYTAWWADWAIAMARVFSLPFTINFVEVKEAYKAFKERREINDIIWRCLAWR